jgi:hypothetical protein
VDIDEEHRELVTEQPLHVDGARRAPFLHFYCY